MRILFVIHQFFPEFSSGTERVTLNLARMMQRAGHQVCVLTCALDGSRHTSVPCRELPGAASSVFEGIPIKLLPRESLPPTADYSLEVDPTMAARLVAWIEARQFDLGHISHCMRMGTAVRAIQEARLPYVLALTDFFLPCSRINLTNLDGKPCSGPDGGRQCGQDCLAPPWSSESLVSRYQQALAVVSSAGFCIAPSRYVAGRYRKAFPELDVKVIPHGVDMLSVVQAGAEARQAQSGDPVRLGYIGTAVPQKGLLVLLRAMAVEPDLPLHLTVICPAQGDPVYRAEVEKMAAADRRIQMLGSMAQKAAFHHMRSLDLLCLPSVVPESFSMVLHECAAAGVPAFVSDLGAPAQTVARSGAGRVLPAGDVMAWAAALAELAHQPEMLSRWKDRVPLPLRVEEEAFFYESYYRQLLTA